ncbi:MAG: hypothetical protein F4X19_08195 [Acidobacteria bacterium]|nr:hypothetical protein [Acidobacteriota bacterium]MYC82055.1 hypothetical protein [Acidobacteriota bacterium]
MRLLLDEQVPRRLKRSFPGHSVQTVRDMGWNGKSNGELLALARDEFDAFITLDRKLEYQQNITEEDIPIIVLITKRISIEYLQPLVPKVLQALNDPNRGEVVHIEA